MTSNAVFSSYVITDPCVGVKDGTCVEVCPVDCIETTPEEERFYIDPALCIACEQCVLVCPVDAIYLAHDVPEQWGASIEKNEAFFLRAQANVPSVSAEKAALMLRAAEERAIELGIDVSIAVVDQRGELVASDRTGAAAASMDEESLNKAYSSVMFELSTQQISERLVRDAADGIDRERVVREAGGIPFGRPYVLGAIGVAGGTPEQDHECSRVAVTAQWPG